MKECIRGRSYFVPFLFSFAELCGRKASINRRSMKKASPGEEQVRAESVPAICRSFELGSDVEFSSEENGLSFDAMRQALIRRIEFLLRQNRDKLKSLLYRIDVDERRLGEKLQSGKEGSEAELIADEIIRRQMQKVRTRILYREGKL